VGTPAPGKALLSVVVAGGTGLVGRCLLTQLGARSDTSVTALVRRAGTVATTGVTEKVFDFQDPAAYAALPEPIDIFLCSLGTTLRKAGSPAAFESVDRDLPLRFIEHLKGRTPPPRFGLVSSVGADSGKGLYLRTKRTVELALIESGLPHVIVRPSILVGERGESRPLEYLGIQVLTPLSRLLMACIGRRSSALGRLAPIPADKVAAALIRYTIEEQPFRSTIRDGWDLW
jgi:uncharacterized protein YbjT (DUF2867 family)